jgi:hypothetical protein
MTAGAENCFAHETTRSVYELSRIEDQSQAGKRKRRPLTDTFGAPARTLKVWGTLATHKAVPATSSIAVVSNQSTGIEVPDSQYRDCPSIERILTLLEERLRRFVERILAGNSGPNIADRVISACAEDCPEFLTTRQKVAGQLQELKFHLGHRSLMDIMCVDHVLAGLSREVLASIEALNARIVETLCLSTA